MSLLVIIVALGLLILISLAAEVPEHHTRYWGPSPTTTSKSTGTGTSHYTSTGTTTNKGETSGNGVYSSTTPLEDSAVDAIHLAIASPAFYEHPWLQRGVSRVEILRFLRARNMNHQVALDLLMSHAAWRVSSVGPDRHPAAGSGDSASLRTFLAECIYWSGLSRDDCAVLVVDSRAFATAADDTEAFLRYMGC